MNLFDGLSRAIFHVLRNQSEWIAYSSRETVLLVDVCFRQPVIIFISGFDLTENVWPK